VGVRVPGRARRVFGERIRAPILKGGRKKIGAAEIKWSMGERNQTGILKGGPSGTGSRGGESGRPKQKRGDGWGGYSE